MKFGESQILKTSHIPATAFIFSRDFLQWQQLLCIVEMYFSLH